MMTINILFVICWGFSLILFFLSGFTLNTIMQRKAKAEMMGNIKDVAVKLIERQKNE